MDPSPALESFARRWAAKLANIYDRIERCEVVIERPHQSQHQGQRVHVRVTLAVPGPDIVASDDPDLDAEHEDAYVAVRDAFRAARRQLVAHAQRDHAVDHAALRP